MQKSIICGALLWVLLFATQLNAHTPAERRADLVEELSQHFDPEWIADIFNHQNLCEGKEIPQKRLKSWGELEHEMMSEPSLARGEFFFRSNESMLQATSEQFEGGELMPFVILSILRIESDLGENRTGTPVARVLFNKYHRVVDGPAGNAGRAKVFREEILPFFEAAEENQWDVCEIRGSRAAAFGYPHFIPASLRLTVDGDGDGKIDIVWNLTDATHSIANYLTKVGWGRSPSRAVFRYNHDNRYVRIVFRYAEAIRERVD